MTREEYYYPCSTCHHTECVFTGREDSHIKCKDYTPQESVLDKIRAEIAEYGLWVIYATTDRSDKDIEHLVSDILKQAKEQVLDVIDKYKAEQEDN